MDNLWWVKSRRAQSDTDYETWIQGGVVPTLNVFDNTTDTRATVLIAYNIHSGSKRQDRPLGGFYVNETDIARTLDASGGLDPSKNDGGIAVLIAWSIREDAKANTFSATELQTTNALQAHQPSVQSHHAQTFITGEQPVEPIPLDMRNAGRDPEKHDEMNRQGVGVGNEGDPAHTVTSTFVNGVAHDIVTVAGDVTHSLTAEGHDASEDGTGRGTPIIGFQPTDGGFANFSDDNQSTTLKASDPAAIAYSAEAAEATSVFTTNQRSEIRDLGDLAVALQASHGTNQSNYVGSRTIVRRLTPTECERLQGFPDGWTAQRLDDKTGQLVEQKDSSRYKQMGNAVAIPCVQWLLSRIVERMDNV